MIYTVISSDGNSYDLPSKTLAVMEQLDAMLKIDSDNKLSLKQKYTKLHEFVKKLIGNDNAKELLGSDNINEVELSELSLTILKIRDAYNKPINDYNGELMADALSSLPTDKITAITQAAEALKK